MFVLTTLEAWRTASVEADPRRALRRGPAVRVPDLESAPAVADKAFPDGQVVSLALSQARSPSGPPAVVRYGRRAPDGRHLGFDVRPATAEALDLLPHPEGGWFRRTWETGAQVRPDGYPGERPTASCVYFLLPAGARSMWHSVRSDELWLWHRGGPLALSLGGSGPSPRDARTILLGPDLGAGQAPQAVAPGGVWQAARPATDQEVLVTCVVSPGFDFADFRTPDADVQVQVEVP